MMANISHRLTLIREKMLSERRLILIVGILILLPLVIGSVFFVNKREPQAASSAPTNIKTTRISTVAGEVCFDTDLPVEAALRCSIGITGVKIFCGKDATPQMSRCLKTSDFDVTLNSGTGYYVFINTGREQESLAYIPASPDDPKFSLDAESYTEEALWICRGESGFDPALDINQDGCVNLADMDEFY